jgi:hypothetical protein
LKFCDEISGKSTTGGGDPTDQAHDGGIGMRAKYQASKISKVSMSKLLGGVIFELVLTLLNLDFEIDQS